MDSDLWLSEAYSEVFSSLSLLISSWITFIISTFKVAILIEASASASNNISVIVNNVPNVATVYEADIGIITKIAMDIEAGGSNKISSLLNVAAICEANIDVIAITSSTIQMCSA